MSRREGRESDTRRSHSRIEREREPSPKRSRRDGKPKTERNTSRNYDVDTLQDIGQDQKLRRRLQDALPLEAPLETESKVESESAKSELKKKSDEKESDQTKDSSNPTEVPRSRSYFQHDERGIAGQGGRSFSRRATTDRRWNDTKDKSSEKRGDEVDVKNPRKREERTQARGDENNVWHHDRFHEVEADATRSARKRPAFRETKVEQESGNTTASTATESGKPSRHEEPVSENSRREERGGRHPYESDRFKRPFTGDRAPLHRRDTQRVGFSSRERFGDGGGGSMGRGRFSGRYEERNQNNIIRGEKWKHDMFHEANKSPSPKTADDEIAKVEALLAS